VLAAHIDFFPTLAEITGAKLSADTKKQIEGRSLVSLLENPAGTLPDRIQFTHQGRWPKFADPNTGKYKMCSVRNTRWHLVSANGAAEPKWELFDVKADPGEQTDVAAKHPEVVKELAAAYEKFWAEAVPLMVNEKAVGPAINPFQKLYYQQFGDSPTPEDLAKMDPNRKFGEEAPKAAKKKKKS